MPRHATQNCEMLEENIQQYQILRPFWYSASIDFSFDATACEATKVHRGHEDPTVGVTAWLKVAVYYSF